MKSLRFALIQMSSSAKVEENLKKMSRFFNRAADLGADCVVFPEMAYQMGPKALWRHELERYPHYIDLFQSWALKAKTALIPGTLREPSPRLRAYYNSLPVISAAGKLQSTYRKLHLFQANLPDRRYNECAYTEAGRDTITTVIGGVRVGLSICFDLRFPELYRALRNQDAEVILVPSAFVFETGKAHWEVLLRARAIENQVFVLAPNQTGVVGTGSKTFGNTMAISPWGEVLSQKKSSEGIVWVEIDRKKIKDARAKVDAWAGRRKEIFSLGG